MPRKPNLKRQKKRRVELPRINWSRMISASAALALIATVYVCTLWLMDQSIDAVVVNGAFQRVSAMQIEESLAPHVKTGFLSADLGAMQSELAAVPWVAQASIRRRWPRTIEVSITEEQAAACWGERGLLNTAGELFVTDASHVPAELPRLAGPDGAEARVAGLYFRLAKRLEQRGLAALALSLDGRGAWQLRLNNGIEVRLGARAVDLRIDRFFVALDRVISREADAVEYVDMRYTNGFSVGWKAGRGRAASSGTDDQPRV
jgi:cell division protein FtsQ